MQKQIPLAVRSLEKCLDVRAIGMLIELPRYVTYDPNTRRPDGHRRLAIALQTKHIVGHQETLSTG